MILEFMIVVGVIVCSMVLHELAHGVTAYLLGDTTAKEDGRLTLNPLVHLDLFMSLILPLVMFLTGGVVFGGAKPVPVNSDRLKGGKWGMALVALAGPATNFLLALVGFLIGWFSGNILTGAGGEVLITTGAVGKILSRWVAVNLGFMVFNLIPISPLDGSRVIYPLMPDSVQEGMKKMEKFGIIVVYLLLVLGGGFLSWIMNGAISGVWGLFLKIVGG